MKKQQNVIGQNQVTYTSTKGVISMVNNKNKPTEDQLTMFKKAIKVGVYKELHQKKMITDEQLNELIKINRVVNSCISQS